MIKKIVYTSIYMCVSVVRGKILKAMKEWKD